MNYRKCYNSITNNAKDRVLEGYGEKHHIIPRCMGGLDTPDNLVKLTAREHFICHWLLTKMHIGQDYHKMVHALMCMKAGRPNQERYESKTTARVYEHYRIEYSKSITGRKREPFSDDWKANLKANHRSKQPGFDGSHSKETKRKMSKKATGRKQSAETIKKKADAVRGSKRLKKHCPHCHRDIAVNTYPRFHGEKCKSK